jgi:hypothetical protein
MTTYSANRRPDTLGDLLERVLDRGVVIVGDIVVNVVDVELLTLKVRLLIASVDTAKSMGIDWWTNDPFLNSAARRDQLEAENEELRARVEALEGQLPADAIDTPRGSPAAPERRSVE